MPLDHLIESDRWELIMYASRLEWMIEEAVRYLKRDPQSLQYLNELDAELGRLRYQLREKTK